VQKVGVNALVCFQPKLVTLITTMQPVRLWDCECDWLCSVHCDAQVGVSGWKLYHLVLYWHWSAPLPIHWYGTVFIVNGALQALADPGGHMGSWPP